MTTTTTTARYELRITTDFKGWKAGEVLTVRQKAILRKEEWIPRWKGSALREVVPCEMIKVYKITRTVTETEEVIPMKQTEKAL
jgi:hypothetical protein